MKIYEPAPQLTKQTTAALFDRSLIGDALGIGTHRRRQLDRIITNTRDGNVRMLPRLAELLGIERSYNAIAYGRIVRYRQPDGLKAFASPSAVIDGISSHIASRGYSPDLDAPELALCLVSALRATLLLKDPLADEASLEQRNALLDYVDCTAPRFSRNFTEVI